jgi:predicted MFS family arabinose efflux permease
MEGSGAMFVATAQIALASGALLGGMAVDHLGINSAMVVGGLFALGCALAIWKFGHDRDGGPALQLVAAEGAPCQGCEA